MLMLRLICQQIQYLQRCVLLYICLSSSIMNHCSCSWKGNFSSKSLLFVASPWSFLFNMLMIFTTFRINALSSPLQLTLQHRTFFNFPYLARLTIPITIIKTSSTPALIEMIEWSLYSDDSSFGSVSK